MDNRIELYITIYYASINLLLFVMMLVDKRKAKKHKYRLSEKSLFVTAVMGGALGGFLAMFVFRHKVRKSRFWIVFGVSVILHIVIILVMLDNGIDICKIINVF